MRQRHLQNQLGEEPAQPVGGSDHHFGRIDPVAVQFERTVSELGHVEQVLDRFWM